MWVVQKQKGLCQPMVTATADPSGVTGWMSVADSNEPVHTKITVTPEEEAARASERVTVGRIARHSSLDGVKLQALCEWMFGDGPPEGVVVEVCLKRGHHGKQHVYTTTKRDWLVFDSCVVMLEAGGEQDTVLRLNPFAGWCFVHAIDSRCLLLEGRLWHDVWKKHSYGSGSTAIGVEPRVSMPAGEPSPFVVQHRQMWDCVSAACALERRQGQASQASQAWERTGGASDSDSDGVEELLKTCINPFASTASQQVKSWGEVLHDCLVFHADAQRGGFLLSLQPFTLKNLRLGLEAAQELERHGVVVPESFTDLSQHVNEVLGSMTGHLRSKEEAKQVLSGKYHLTIDNLLKMVAVYARLRCGIPVVLLGECGCGKTMLINYVAACV